MNMTKTILALSLTFTGALVQAAQNNVLEPRDPFKLTSSISDSGPTQMEIARSELQQRLNGLSTSDLERVLWANRAQYLGMCGLGAISDFTANVGQLIPVVSFFTSFTGFAFAESISGVERAPYAAANPVHASVSVALLGSIAGVVWDAVEGSTVFVDRAANGLVAGSSSYQWIMTRSGLDIMRANYTRLVGRNSGCGRAIARASVAHLELEKRAREQNSQSRK